MRHCLVHTVENEFKQEATEATRYPHFKTHKRGTHINVPCMNDQLQRTDGGEYKSDGTGKQCRINQGKIKFAMKTCVGEKS